jgi:hypothetical protein
MTQKAVSDLQKQLADMHKKHQDDLSEICRKYDEKIASLVQTITDLQKTMPGIIADAVKNAVQSALASVKTMSKDIVKNSAAAIEQSIAIMLEKKEKQKNLVLVGLPEGDEETDWDRVSQMAIKAGIPYPDQAIKTVFRDGAKGKKRSDGSIIPRIMKIRFRNKAYREAMLTCGRYKEMGGDFAYAYLRHDMTYDERVKNKELRAELQRRREVDSNQNLVIRNGEIIYKRFLTRNNQRGN